jgi:hypothetical protein
MKKQTIIFWIAIAAVATVGYFYIKKKKTAAPAAPAAVAPVTAAVAANNKITALSGGSRLIMTQAPKNVQLQNNSAVPVYNNSLTTGLSVPAPHIPINYSAPYIPDNYGLWASYMIHKLHDTGNIDIANQLNAQLAALINGVPSTGSVYNMDTAAYYNKTVPVITTTPAATQQLTSKQVFDNTVSVFCLIAKNYVQANTNGQAIGSRQGIINNAYNTVRNNDTANNIPQSTAAVIYFYNCAVANVWPIGNGGGAQIPANDTLTIIKAVSTGVSIAALLL